MPANPHEFFRLEWSDRDSSDRFSAAVVEAIAREHGASALEVAA